MKITMFITLFVLSLSVFAKNDVLQKDGLYAKFDTNKGEIIAELFYKQTPLTIINFVGLAEGKKDNSVKQGKPFYDGLTFHRVIKNFMIQGGDPQGTGRGGPGYKFVDEIVPALKHDKAGILSMANSGPGTNGSQFFITHNATPWLNGKHTVFGRVVQGIDVVNKIVKGDKIKTLKIIRVGKDAKAFIANEASFNKLLDKLTYKTKERVKEDLKEFDKYAQKNYPKAKKTKSGLYYIILKKGTGKKPNKGDTVSVHYEVKLTDGKNLGSSRTSKKPISVAIGIGHVIKAWDEAVLTMKEGGRRILIVPYNLAYGEKGRPSAIPPKATLIFDLELLEVTNKK